MLFYPILYLLTYIICAIETSCDANLFLPFASIQFFNSRCYLKGGYAIDHIWTTIGDVASAARHDIGARNWKFFEVDQALEVLRVPLVKILAREMRLKTTKLGNVASVASHSNGARKAIEFFWSRPSFGDVASAASHDIGARNAIENLLKSTNVWRCCECR